MRNLIENAQHFTIDALILDERGLLSDVVRTTADINARWGRLMPDVAKLDIPCNEL
jgi:hypothetical protein